MQEVRLIDANALHAKILEENRGNFSATENVAQILLRIEIAPTIEAEPMRHGRWENGKCTNCKHNLIDLCGGEDYELAMYAEFDAEFCPFCGARMDMEDDV